MIGYGSSWIIGDAPTKNSSLFVANVDDFVILGNGNGSDGGRILVIFSIESRVHSELSSKSQLPVPLVSLAQLHRRTPESSIGPHIGKGQGGGSERQDS